MLRSNSDFSGTRVFAFMDRFHLYESVISGFSFNIPLSNAIQSSLSEFGSKISHQFMEKYQDANQKCKYPKEKGSR